MVHIKNILKKRKQSPEISGRDLPSQGLEYTSGGSGFTEIHPQTVTPLRVSLRYKPPPRTDFLGEGQRKFQG